MKMPLRLCLLQNQRMSEEGLFSNDKISAVFEDFNAINYFNALLK